MLLVDAHVHVYPCFDLAGFFSAAARQFQAASADIRPGSDCLPIIVLADWSRQSWFRQFKHSADRPEDAQRLAVPGWSFHPTGDQLSVQVESAAGQRMIVLAGRKIISAENLEVLALGTTGTFEDGLSLAATIEAIRRHPDAPVPVVPWAVGKWWGRRGKVLEGVMRQASEPFFYLCDNGNRPTFWPRPSHFQLADRLGIRVLAGSDPLHFASDGLRVGRYGFMLPARVPLRRPASDFKQALAESAPEPIQLFGPLESTERFLINQIRMQIFKKKWKKELLK